MCQKKSVHLHNINGVDTPESAATIVVEGWYTGNINALDLVLPRSFDNIGITGNPYLKVVIGMIMGNANDVGFDFWERQSHLMAVKRIENDLRLLALD